MEEDGGVANEMAGIGTEKRGPGRSQHLGFLSGPGQDKTQTSQDEEQGGRQRQVDGCHPTIVLPGCAFSLPTVNCHFLFLFAKPHFSLLSFCVLPLTFIYFCRFSRIHSLCCFCFLLVCLSYYILINTTTLSTTQKHFPTDLDLLLILRNPHPRSKQSHLPRRRVLIFDIALHETGERTNRKGTHYYLLERQVPTPTPIFFFFSPVTDIALPERQGGLHLSLPLDIPLLSPLQVRLRHPVRSAVEPHSASASAQTDDENAISEIGKSERHVRFGARAWFRTRVFPVTLLTAESVA